MGVEQDHAAVLDNPIEFTFQISKLVALRMMKRLKSWTSV